ncbi:ladinin-1 [Pleurodeles waltl]|uniref:ladinin-1 n=1 Tax=Pleurodeles waltl TaxID=8319 RepID=UPI0037093C1C
MSLSRRNWSALSSLAKQRTLEDEEEIIREQRRRNRNLSSSTETSDDLSFSFPTVVEQVNAGSQSAKARQTQSERLESERPALERAHHIDEPELQESLGPDDDEKKFLEILKSRERRRQRRQVEILETIKQEQQDDRKQESEPRHPLQANHAPKSKKEKEQNQQLTPVPSQQPVGSTLHNKENEKTGTRTDEHFQKVSHAVKCINERETGEPRTTESQQQPSYIIESKKESEDGVQKAELSQHSNHEIECKKERGAAPTPQKRTIKQVVSLSATQATADEQRSSVRPCLKTPKVGSPVLVGHISLASISAPTGSTAETTSPVRSTSTIKSASSFNICSSDIVDRHNNLDASNDGLRGKMGSNRHDGPNNNEGSTSHDDLHSYEHPSNHETSSSQDQAKELSHSPNHKESTFFRKGTNVPSSVPTRLERTAGAKSPSGPTSNIKATEGSASGLSTVNPPTVTTAITQTGTARPADLKSPTSISLIPTQTKTSQVFVSSIKLARNKSADNPEVKQVRKLVTQRSVEKISECKTEAAGAKPSTEGTAVEQKKPLPQIEAKQTFHLQLHTVWDEKKDTSMREVKPPSSSPDGPACSGVTSPGVTESGSALRRFSPRTSSFRIMSQTEQAESPFTRSASLRIPSRNFKLDAKLEKYASALQKAESVKSPTRTKEFFPIPEGVASKRSVFEREATSSGGSTPTSGKSNTSLTGAVSSRINQWLSKTQVDGSKNSGTKEVKKVDIASKRSLWEQRSSSTDTKP